MAPHVRDRHSGHHNDEPDLHHPAGLSHREPSQAHFDLARLLNAGLVEAVVSYNWDTCLERAHEQLYGVALPAGMLHKPHGDAARPDENWVFPDEAGLVPTDVRDHVLRLTDRPRVLLMVGYSASDAAVVEALLEPLEQRWPVVRIGPSASGEGAIACGADEALAGLTSPSLEPNGAVRMEVRDLPSQSKLPCSTAGGTSSPRRRRRLPGIAVSAAAGEASVDLQVCDSFGGQRDGQVGYGVSRRAAAQPSRMESR